MQSSVLPDSDDDRVVGDSLAEGSEEEVKYEEIEVEEEVEIEEEVEVEEVETEEEMEGDTEFEEEMVVKEVKQIQKKEEQILEEQSNLPIDIEGKGHQSTRLEVNVSPESVNVHIATIAAPIDDYGGLVINSKASCSNQIRLNQDPFDNMDGCSNMTQHIVVQGNILQSLASENMNSEGIQGREASRDDNGNDGAQSSFYGCENMVAKAFEPLPFPVGEVDSAIFRNECLLKESNPIGLGAEVQATGTQSGLHVREIRPRSLSPTIEFKDGNIRSSLICDFFALGWCIKGNSCKFRHVKGHTDAIESSMDKKELQSNANEDGFGRSGSSEFSNATIPSVVHGSFTLEKVPSLEHGGSTKQNQFYERDLSFQREDPSTLKDMTGFAPSNVSRSMMPNFHRMSTLIPPSFGFSPQELYLPPREYKSTINNIDRFKMKISLYDWEPSVPFQPSFTFTRSLLRGSLYDPIRDCIEQPTLSGTSYRLDATTSNSLHNRDVDNKFSDNVGQQSVSGRNITSKHHSFSNNNNMSDKNSDGRELFLNEKEDSSSSHAGPQSRVPFVKDEKTSDISIKDKKGDITSKVDTRRPITEMEADVTINDQPESKIQKYFRAKLIDFIKELVKPAWREGRLTKTAHKVIVKRMVEKVLSEENEFPSTEDSIQQYLTTSQPKLSKLVAAYIIKYGKS